MLPDGVSTSLKALPGFSVLTAAEAAVFERLLEQEVRRPDERVSPGDAVLVVEQGAVSLAVAAAGGRDLDFATVESGGLIGEVAFFTPRSLPVHGLTQAETVLLRLNRRALKTSFHYSRTGAVKFMVVCAQSLSRKIRSANQVLHALPGASEGTPEVLLPPPLGERALKRLRAFSQSRQVGAGEHVLREGDASTEIYVITEGHVEIVRTGAGGETMRLARLGPGDFFGEMAFVDQRPRSAGARALSPVNLQVLPSSVLEKALDAHLGIAIYLSNLVCKMLARRLDVTLRRIVALAGASR